MSYAETGKFKIAADGIDPESVPQKVLYNGTKIPAIGLGTFGSDKFTGEEIANSVIGAAEVGYRHFDCASVYENEKEIGKAFKIIMNGGIKRKDLFITSKLWNDKHNETDVIPQCKKSLKDLGLDYLDLYLVHWPFPNFHPVGCSVDSRSPDAKPYIHENYMKTWRQMEKLVELGLVKNIGTSNMTIAKLKVVLRDAKIKPVVNEMELHPHFQQQELFDFVTANGIQPIGFSPIGSPNRPERDKTENDTVDIEDPVVVAAAKRLNVHPACICIKWGAQRGQIPIPFSTRRAGYLSNLYAVVNDPLTNEEMKAIAANDKNCRLIKGQVFLWKDHQDWTDLWDPDGTISQ
jgi:alcohol dehydrogenase (NADP+)